MKKILIVLCIGVVILSFGLIISSIEKKLISKNAIINVNNQMVDGKLELIDENGKVLSLNNKSVQKAFFLDLTSMILSLLGGVIIFFSWIKLTFYRIRNREKV